MMIWLLACTVPKELDSAQVLDSAQNTSSPPPFQCPSGEFDQELGRVNHPEISETSGIAISKYDPQQIWLHNDSGDSARLFAIQSDGTSIGEAHLEIHAQDWEDMAINQDLDGTSHIYIGDIGDNNEERENITIHRILEPRDTETVPDVTSIELSYPDRAHNAESLVVHPHTGNLYILTKDLEQTQIFRWDRESSVLIESNRFSFSELGIEGSPLITAADISPDGRVLLLRTYTSIWALDAQILDGAAVEQYCSLPSPQELQGEAIAFSQDGQSYLSIAEGSAPSIFRFSISYGENE